MKLWQILLFMETIFIGIAAVYTPDTHITLGETLTNALLISSPQQKCTKEIISGTVMATIEGFSWNSTKDCNEKCPKGAKCSCYRKMRVYLDDTDSLILYYKYKKGVFGKQLLWNYSRPSDRPIRMARVVLETKRDTGSPYDNYETMIYQLEKNDSRDGWPLYTNTALYWPAENKTSITTGYVYLQHLTQARQEIIVKCEPITEAVSNVTDILSTGSTPKRRFSNHFVAFLRNNPERNKFALDSYANYEESGTFGGREVKEGEEAPRIKHDPIVFVHGNQDSALFVAPPFITGWNSHIEKFLEKGYSMLELYGLTHGQRDVTMAAQYTYTCELIKGVRAQMEAVLEYTQASKIDVISHSMGVTIARAAILGGRMHFTAGPCEVGESLASKVDTFLGIAGANYGLCFCNIPGLDAFSGCQDDGFMPGFCQEPDESESEAREKAFLRCGKKAYNDTCIAPTKYGRVMQDLNEREEQRVGDFVVSAWSSNDDIIGEGTEVFGRTSAIMPGSDLNLVFENLTHVESKDIPTEAYFKLVTSHEIHKKKSHHENQHHHKAHESRRRHIHVKNYLDLE